MPGYQHQQTPQQASESESGGLLDSVLPLVAGPLSGVGAWGMQGLLGNGGVQDLLNTGGGLLDTAGSGLDWLGDKVNQGTDWLGDKVTQGSDWLGDQWEGAKSWGGEKLDAAGEWLNNKIDPIKEWGSDWMDGIDQEGLGAVFDPTGAVDRQRAQEELADRFSVVPDDFVGPRLPNQVTQAEYEQIAHTYSDIRMGRSDFEFNTEGLSDEDAEAFRQGSMNDLASIMQTEHGRTLINDLAYNENDHQTTLSPLYKKDGSNNYDPSLGLDNTNGFASPADRSKTWLNADGTAGEGSDSRVRYNPGQTISPVGATDDWLPWRSDVLLYHELTHSRDHTMGTLVDGQDSVTGENLREQRATGLGAYADETISENAYRRDRQLIAAGGVGARDGDADMPHRDSYFYHTAPAAAPGSTGPGSPGTARDPHGDHDHDH